MIMRWEVILLCISGLTLEGEDYTHKIYYNLCGIGIGILFVLSVGLLLPVGEINKSN
jgi:hypothetical protein